MVFFKFLFKQALTPIIGKEKAKQLDEIELAGKPGEFALMKLTINGKKLKAQQVDEKSRKELEKLSNGLIEELNADKINLTSLSINYTTNDKALFQCYYLKNGQKQIFKKEV